MKKTVKRKKTTPTKKKKRFSQDFIFGGIRRIKLSSLTVAAQYGGGGCPCPCCPPINEVQ